MAGTFVNLFLVFSSHVYALRCIRGGPKIRAAVCGYGACTCGGGEDIDNDSGSSVTSSVD